MGVYFIRCLRFTCLENRIFLLMAVLFAWSGAKAERCYITCRLKRNRSVVGGVLVGDAIKINIELEIVKQEAPEEVAVAGD
jgi:hypothetical protein